MLTVRDRLILLKGHLLIQVFPVCSGIEKILPRRKKLCFRYFHPYIPMIIKGHQHRHFVNPAHVRGFKDVNEFPSDSAKQFFFLRQQITLLFHVFEIVLKQIIPGVGHCQLVGFLLHVCKQVHPHRPPAQLLFHFPILPRDSVTKPQLLIVHFAEKVNETHIKIHDTVVREGICPSCTSGKLCHRACFFICIRTGSDSGQKIPTDIPGLFVIADKIQHLQVFFSRVTPKPAAKLLEENHRRFRRPKEHDHVHRRNVHAFIEHVYRENHPDLLSFQHFNRCLPVNTKALFCQRLAVYSNSRNSSFGKCPCHVFGMRPGTAKTQRPPGTVFAVILVDQVVPPFVVDIPPGKLIFIKVSAHQTETFIVRRIIVDSVISKRHEHPLIDRFTEGNFVGDIVITEFVNTPAVHPLGCCGQPQHKPRFKVFRDPPVLLRNPVMYLVYDHILEIIRSEIPRIQIFAASQRRDGGKYHRLVRAFDITVEKAKRIRPADFPKGLRRLPQDLLPVRDKKYPLIFFRVKCSENCFPNACRRENECL